MHFIEISMSFFLRVSLTRVKQIDWRLRDNGIESWHLSAIASRRNLHAAKYRRDFDRRRKAGSFLLYNIYDIFSTGCERIATRCGQIEIWNWICLRHDRRLHLHLSSRSLKYNVMSWLLQHCRWVCKMSCSCRYRTAESLSLKRDATVRRFMIEMNAWGTARRAYFKFEYSNSRQALVKPIPSLNLLTFS